VEDDECVCSVVEAQMKAIKLSAKHKKFIFIADYGDLHNIGKLGKMLNWKLDNGQWPIVWQLLL